MLLCTVMMCMVLLDMPCFIAIQVAHPTGRVMRACLTSRCKDAVCCCSSASCSSSCLSLLLRTAKRFVAVDSCWPFCSHSCCMALWFLSNKSPHATVGQLRQRKCFSTICHSGYVRWLCEYGLTFKESSTSAMSSCIDCELARADCCARALFLSLQDTMAATLHRHAFLPIALQLLAVEKAPNLFLLSCC